MFSRVSVLGPNVQQLTCLQFFSRGKWRENKRPQDAFQQHPGRFTGAPSSTIFSRSFLRNFTSETPTSDTQGPKDDVFHRCYKISFGKKLFWIFFGHFSSKGWAAKDSIRPLRLLQNINRFSPKVLHKSSCTQRSHTWPITISLEKTSFHHNYLSIGRPSPVISYSKYDMKVNPPSQPPIAIQSIVSIVSNFKAIWRFGGLHSTHEIGHCLSHTATCLVQRRDVSKGQVETIFLKNGDQK